MGRWDRFISRMRSWRTGVFRRMSRREEQQAPRVQQAPPAPPAQAAQMARQALPARPARPAPLGVRERRVLLAQQVERERQARLDRRVRQVQIVP